jgi:hypothetical protein
MGIANDWPELIQRGQERELWFRTGQALGVRGGRSCGEEVNGDVFPEWPSSIKRNKREEGRVGAYNINKNKSSRMLAGRRYRKGVDNGRGKKN